MIQLAEGILIAEHYKLVKQLGRGCFGEVWLAHNVLADIDVAIKFYGSFDMKGLEEFRSEFKLAYKLHHPNLLNISHFDVCNNCPFLVMPYCSNGSVSRQKGKMAEADIWQFASDVSAGLAFLHQQHPPIIHQDIKPDNILITADGRYVISDFGISRNLRTQMSRVNNSGSSGTIAYMGPERFSSSPVIVLASDVWAFGMTLYELMSGDVMWEGMGGCAQLQGARIPAIDKRFSPQLSRLVTACLDLQTWNRPTAEQVHSYVEAYLHHQVLPPLSSCDDLPGEEPVRVQHESVNPKPVQSIPAHLSTHRENVFDSLHIAGLTKKRLLVVFAALLIVAILITGITMFYSSVREKQRFVSCQTLQDYQQFISDYPNSSHVEIARKRIADLTLTPIQKTVVKEETPTEGQQSVPDKTPTKIQQPIIKQTIVSVTPTSQPNKVPQRSAFQQSYSTTADDEAFYNCVTLKDYNNYLSQFPNGRHREQAIHVLTTLAGSKRDNAIPPNDLNSRPFSGSYRGGRWRPQSPGHHPHSNSRPRSNYHSRTYR